jgi:hypothetical protein
VRKLVLVMSCAVLGGGVVAGAWSAGIRVPLSSPAAQPTLAGTASYPHLATLSQRARGEMLAARERATAAAKHGGLSAELALVAGSRDPQQLAVTEHVQLEGDRAHVVVAARDADVAAARAAIEAAGGRVVAVSGNLLDAQVPVRALPGLASASGVAAVRNPAAHFGELVAGEEVGATSAEAWHKVGLTGAGVKIGIVDLGFGGLAQRQAEGEVPKSATLVDYCGGDTQSEVHGTAVAEIVSEEAPGAQLYLICVNSEVTLSVAEYYAKQNGIKIISHSVGWFDTWRGDGSGPAGTPDAVVADAHANGILWVNSAGNEAQNHWSGVFTDTNGNGVNEFAPGVETNQFKIGANAVGCALLRWNNWPIADDDYDVAIVDVNTHEVLAVSALNQAQAGPLPPIEAACYQNPASTSQFFAFSIVARKVTKPADFDLFIEGRAGSLQYPTATRSIGDPATSPGALAAGAICYENNALEPFSSQGPTIDGRMKPELAAPDGVSGVTYGAASHCVLAKDTTGFLGTSAAAPVTAAAAALVKQRYPSYTADQITAYLEKSARDLGTPGPDNSFGAGGLLLPPIPAPKVQAKRAGGRAGAQVRLSYTAFDDASDIRARLRVYRGSTVVKTVTSGYEAARTAKTFTVAWVAPKVATQYRFCVQGTDRAGTSGAPSCAAIVLRR